MNLFCDSNILKQQNIFNINKQNGQILKKNISSTKNSHEQSYNLIMSIKQYRKDITNMVLGQIINKKIILNDNQRFNDQRQYKKQQNKKQQSVDIRKYKYKLNMQNQQQQDHYILKRNYSLNNTNIGQSFNNNNKKNMKNNIINQQRNVKYNQQTKYNRNHQQIDKHNQNVNKNIQKSISTLKLYNYDKNTHINQVQKYSSRQRNKLIKQIQSSSLYKTNNQVKSNIKEFQKSNNIINELKGNSKNNTKQREVTIEPFKVEEISIITSQKQQDSSKQNKQNKFNKTYKKQLSTNNSLNSSINNKKKSTKLIYPKAQTYTSRSDYNIDRISKKLENYINKHLKNQNYINTEIK